MYRNLALCLLLGLIALYSCQRNNSPSPETGSISVSRTVIRMDTLVGVKDTFSIRASGPWMAELSSADGNWLQLDRTSGGRGDSVITLQVLSNNGSAAPQTAAVTISLANDREVHPAVVTLTQRSYTVHVVWQKFMGTPYPDEGTCISKSGDGGFFVGGGTGNSAWDHLGGIGKPYNFWVARLDSSGNPQWSNIYGGLADELPFSIVSTADGGCVAAGYTYSNDGDVMGNQGGYDWWVLKLDDAGHKQWARTFGGTGTHEYAYSIVTTPDGGYALTGTSDSRNGDITESQEEKDIFVLKLDGSGNKQWARNFGRPGDFANAIVSTSDGGYLIAGTFGTQAMRLIRTDAVGNEQWSKTYAGGIWGVPCSMLVTTDGGVAICGVTDDNPGNDQSNSLAWVAKLDGFGNVQWSKAYGGMKSDNAYSLTATPGGGYVFTGSSSSSDGDITDKQGAATDLWVMGLDEDGNKLWSKTLHGAGKTYGLQITTATDGEYGVAGVGSGDAGSGLGYPDIWVLKLKVQ